MTLLEVAGIKIRDVGNVLIMLKNYTWIFGIIELLLFLLVISTINRIRKNKKSDAKILNRYNPDGTERAQRGTFATNLSVYALLMLFDFVVWYIIANI